MVVSQVLETQKESEASIRYEIYPLIPFCERYDDAEVIDSSSFEDSNEWRIRNEYLQRYLCNMGAVSEIPIMKPEDSQLVGYTFPKEEEYEATLLFTSRKKDIIKIIDAVSNRIVRNIPYFGILVKKTGEMLLVVCSGKKNCDLMQIPIDEITDDEQMFVNMLLRCWTENPL